jgi:hypothetical protein
VKALFTTFPLRGTLRFVFETAPTGAIMSLRAIRSALLALAALIGACASAFAEMPQYAWVAAEFPPDDVVTAPDNPKKAVCRGTDDSGYLWAGYWADALCVGASGGNVKPAQNNVEFLTLVAGTPQWVSGSGKDTPSDIGQVPPNAVDAGKTAWGESQVLCSQGGYVGRVSSTYCSIGVHGLNGQQNATVLVGTVR